MARSRPIDQEARENLALLYDMVQELTSARELQTVLQRLLVRSIQHVGAIRGTILVLDEESRLVETAFFQNETSREYSAPQLDITYEKGLAGWVARHRQPVLVADTSKDTRWLSRPDDSITRTGPKSAISVPILAQDQLVGVITLIHPKIGFFTDIHLDLVNAIAGQAGAVIRNAWLFKRMQTAHQRYQELFDDSIDPILITDFHGKIIEANQQARIMLGYRNDETRELSLKDLDMFDWPLEKEKIDLLAAGKTIKLETTAKQIGGGRIPVQISARKIAQKTGDQLQWILRDITERKDLDRMREDLSSMVYHDLRSPLANIVSSLEIIRALFPDEIDETVYSLVTIALRSTERIQRLTDTLLDISRFEAGQKNIKRQPINVKNLVMEVGEIIQPTVASKALDLTMNIPLSIPEILGDVEMLRRVLINLVENAIKFTPSEGKIQVSVLVKNTFVEFSVKDSGVGIPDHDQQRIFEKFTRLADQEGTRGLGLGLAYCRMAVQAHGGDIWVESQPGNGSKFIFTIPIA